MSKLMNLYFLIIFSVLGLFLNGCQVHKAPLQPVKSTYIAEKRIPIASASKVLIKGRVNLDLHTGYKQSILLLKGDANTLASVMINQSAASTIAISSNSPVHAELRLNKLDSLHYVGNGTITGNKIQAQALQLYINNPGRTQLSGRIILRELVITGGGNVTLQGVLANSLAITVQDHSHLTLSGALNIRNLNIGGDSFINISGMRSTHLSLLGRDHVHITLAGMAKLLEINLWDYAECDARNMYTTRAFVKTHDHSAAKINIKARQHALALDASDIYFYHKAQMQTNLMGNNGAVLDLKDWHR